MDKIVQLLAATAELMGMQITAPSLAIMAKDFSGYQLGHIEAALKNVRLNHTKFSPAAIQKELDALDINSRPSADEAWAMWPHDESSSAVVNDEMAEAMNIAYPLLEDGDKIGARMAFKDAYNRLITTNKAKGVKPKWFPSLGHDYEGRQLALKEAEILGRLSGGHVQVIGHHETPPLIAQAASLLIENKSVEMTAAQRAKNKQRIYEIKQKLLNQTPNTGNEPGRRD